MWIRNVISTSNQNQLILRNLSVEHFVMWYITRHTIKWTLYTSIKGPKVSPWRGVCAGQLLTACLRSQKLKYLLYQSAIHENSGKGLDFLCSCVGPSLAKSLSWSTTSALIVCSSYDRRLGGSSERTGMSSTLFDRYLKSQFCTRHITQSGKSHRWK